MKTIKNSKEITTLEVDDVVLFGDLEYIVRCLPGLKQFQFCYYLYSPNAQNNQIFKNLHIDIQNFINKLGIIYDYEETFASSGAFPEFYSLEALTVVVSALFKEYEKQQNEFPKTWEEFCKRNPIKTGEYLIESNSSICITKRIGCTRDTIIDKNYFVSQQEAEAFLALMQLRQLRKAYVKDWEPDYKKQRYSCGITPSINGFDIVTYGPTSRSMSFPTRELAKQFLTNFRNLLEIAKPLL